MGECSKIRVTAMLHSYILLGTVFRVVSLYGLLERTSRLHRVTSQNAAVFIFTAATV